MTILNNQFTLKENHANAAHYRALVIAKKKEQMPSSAIPALPARYVFNYINTRYYTTLLEKVNERAIEIGLVFVSSEKRNEQRECPTENQLNDLAQSLVKESNAIIYQRDKEKIDILSDNAIECGYARYWLDEIIEALATVNIFLYQQ